MIKPKGMEAEKNKKTEEMVRLEKEMLPLTIFDERDCSRREIDCWNEKAAIYNDMAKKAGINKAYWKIIY